MGSRNDTHDDDCRYPGGKAPVCKWIASLLPTHAYYAEPFAGKGAVFRHKPPAWRSYLIDFDPRVVEWWNRRNPPGCIVHCGDGRRWLELAAEWCGEDWLVYVDPPYVLSTRTKKRIYARELTDGDHRRILASCLTLADRGASIAVSGYESTLYDLMLDGWHRFEKPAMTRGGVWRTEVLWLSYDPSRAASDLTLEYSALGDDYRERLRVSRKVDRWVAKIEALPAAERKALTLAILSAAGGRRP